MVLAWLTAAGLAGTGCGGTRSLFAPDDGPTGRSGGTAAPEALLGTWEASFLITVPGDIQIWTTRWTFLAGGNCHFRQTSRSTLDDLTIVDDLDCTFSTANGRLRIAFPGGRTVESAYSFPGGDTSRLLFEDVEYRRVGS